MGNLFRNVRNYLRRSENLSWTEAAWRNKKRKTHRLDCYLCILMHAGHSTAGWRWHSLPAERERAGRREQRRDALPAARVSSLGAAEEVKKPVYGSTISSCAAYAVHKVMNPTERLIIVLFFMLS